MQIMLRHAEDDFTALTIANAMMQVGADVVSITDAGGPPFAATIGRFIVWAKVRDEAHISEVDAIIDSPNAGVEPRRGSDVGSNPLLGSCREIANNAIYFADNSDYRSALWEICSLLGMSDDDIGNKFIEPNAVNHQQEEATC